MLTFLHSADWQIGKPYARVQDPDKRARLRQARIDVISRIGALLSTSRRVFLWWLAICLIRQPPATAM